MRRGVGRVGRRMNPYRFYTSRRSPYRFPGTTARPTARSPRYGREVISEESPVRPRGHQRGVPGTTARPSMGSPRYDREVVGEESPVRPRGCRRGVPGTIARSSARSPRYDREVISDQSQTLSVSEGESPLSLPVVVRKRRRFPGNGGIRIPRWEGVIGHSPSLTLRVWLWSLTASRSYRGLPVDGLAVVPGTPHRRPRGRTGDSPSTTSRSYRGSVGRSAAMCRSDRDSSCGPCAA